jgi:hypothetical protein
MTKPQPVRLVEIAELLGVSKQPAHQIADETGFPAPLAEDARGRVWSRYEVQAGEALARREALALAHELHAVGASAARISDPNLVSLGSCETGESGQ